MPEIAHGNFVAFLANDASLGIGPAGGALGVQPMPDRALFASRVEF